MEQVTTKFSYGQDVCCNWIKGKVTAIFIRGKGISYEFSYIDKDDNPASCCREECELKEIKIEKMGFIK